MARVVALWVLVAACSADPDPYVHVELVGTPGPHGYGDLNFTRADGSAVSAFVSGEGTAEVMLGADGRVGYSETDGSDFFLSTSTRWVYGVQPGDHLQFDLRGQGVANYGISPPDGCRCIATTNVRWDPTDGAISWDQAASGHAELRHVVWASPVSANDYTVEVVDGGTATTLKVPNTMFVEVGRFDVDLIECDETYDDLREEAGRTRWSCP